MQQTLNIHIYTSSGIIIDIFGLRMLYFLRESITVVINYRNGIRGLLNSIHFINVNNRIIKSYESNIQYPPVYIESKHQENINLKRYNIFRSDNIVEIKNTLSNDCQL